MDTKLKNFSYRAVFKAIAFMLIVIGLTTAVVQLQYLILSDVNLEALLVTHYRDSAAFIDQDARMAINDVTSALVLSEEDSGNLNTRLGTGYYYYIVDGDTVKTNVSSGDPSFFDSFGEHKFVLNNGLWVYEFHDRGLIADISVENSVKGTIAFTTDYMNNSEKEWFKERDKALPLMGSFAGIGVGTILLILYLTITIGQKTRGGEVILNAIDKIPSDVFLVMVMAFIGVWAIIIDEFFGYRYLMMSQKVASMIAVGTATFGLLIGLGVAYLSLIKRIKAKTLMTNSVVYKVVYGIFDYFRSLFDGRKFSSNKLTKQLFYRQTLFITFSFILVLFTFILLMAPPLFLLPPILEFILVYWFVQGNRKTFEAIDRGFNDSLEEQMKAERMKIQLVTNVSHDLKTPLTAIISYADLLSKEPCLSESSRDYVNILIDKSNRLKNIVSDLFDLAKSTSGDIKLEMDVIDLKRLVEQTMADMEDEITKSELNYKIKLPENPVMIMADGKKLYRVFQNLIDNANKYALKGTRVFIELESHQMEARFSIKNTAAYEMAFSAEEILQRFARGDESRSTDGNGLGLSIAESFTQVCGGAFKLDIDGDLFKVTLRFPEIVGEKKLD